MAQSLFSPLWYRVADQHPRLRSDVRVQRQQQRDQSWYVLVSAIDGSQVRINEAAYRLVGCLDGRRSMQQIWDALLEQYRDDAPTQEEALQLLDQLDAQGLLAGGNATDATVLARKREEREQQRKGFVNPFALRIPLGDPVRLLARFDRLPRWLFNAWTLWIWSGLAAATLLAAASDWSALSQHARTHMATPRYLVLAWVLFPFLKALHEMAHALAVKRWGGEVHEAGFSLFLLVPAPYVDASAANAFRPRHQRAFVGLAGMMAECVVAAVALVAWFNVQPGLVQDAAFVLLFLAGVSTVLFNANPLVTFDGYYVLCDVLDLPNLAPRSRAWWAARIGRLTFGRSGSFDLVLARGETKWLAVYAPLSLAYRLVVSVMLVLWLGTHSFVVGIVAAIALAFLLVAVPVAKGIQRLFDGTHAAHRGRGCAVVSGFAILVLAVLWLVPLPYHTTASAVVWLPDRARVRPEVNGFIVKVSARDGDLVHAGQELVVLDDPVLFASRSKLASELERLQAGRFNALARDTAEARNADEEIQRVQGDLERADQKIASLVLNAKVDGRLVMPHQDDLPGTFVGQGTIVGYVIEKADIRVRAAVPEYEAMLIRDHTRAAEVLTAESGGTATAQIVRDIPAATFDLPSAALGDRGGGPHVTDPADAKGLRTLAPVVLVDLTMPAGDSNRVGGRAWVRFDHGFEPLAGRWYRQVRQVLLQHFNPST